MSAISKVETPIASDIERVVIGGDLSKLNPEQRLSYYKHVCESVGLNPLTRPLQYITLNGKLVLYAGKDATDQLRQMHQVSVTVTAREVVSDCYVVTSKATLPSGRTDEDIGAISIANLKGDALCNAMMKASTKSKRRVTLSICGLGMLDETEIETIPPSQVVREPAMEPESTAYEQGHDPEPVTGDHREVDPLKKPRGRPKAKAREPKPPAEAKAPASPPPIAPRNGAKKITPAQQKRFWAQATHKGWKEPEVRALLANELHIESTAEIPDGKVYNRIVDEILAAGPLAYFEKREGVQ